MSQSLQIRSVISIIAEAITRDIEAGGVAIPSNQVGNFHPLNPGKDWTKDNPSQSLQIRSVISIAISATAISLFPEKSQSLQIRSVISIIEAGAIWCCAGRAVAIPSNQVGNFHHCLGDVLRSRVVFVAIPSNQVGNFHQHPVERQRGVHRRMSQSLQIRSVISIRGLSRGRIFPLYVAIPSNQVGNFHQNSNLAKVILDRVSRNPFKSGR